MHQDMNLWHVSVLSWRAEQKLHRRLSAERKYRNNNDDVAEKPAARTVVLQYGGISLWKEVTYFCCYCSE